MALQQSSQVLPSSVFALKQTDDEFGTSCMCMYISLLPGGLQRHSRKADRPSLFAAFFARKDLVQLKAKFRPLMSKYARFLERKGVRVFGRFAVEAAANFSKSLLACDATRKKRANFSFIPVVRACFCICITLETRRLINPFVMKSNIKNIFPESFFCVRV